MKKIRIGVIGLGHNGRAFCDIYAERSDCELVAVCDLDNSRVEDAVSTYGCKGYTNYEILQDPSIEVISIHTSDNAHREPFIKAIETGHHVFVEKPMADTLEDVEAMVAAYRAHPDCIAAVGHVLRFNRYFEIIKKWVDLGLLGDIFYMEGDYIHDLRYQYYMEDWKISKEIPMLGGGCHPLDLLRWYAGDVTEVTAFSNHIAYPEMAEDASMVAIFKFAGGATGKVTSLYGPCSPMPYGYNLSIYGTKGTVVRDKVSFDGLGHQWMDIPDTFDPTHSYVPEVEHFLDCVRTGKKPLVTPEIAANTVIASLYAVRSAKEKTILKVPQI